MALSPAEIRQEIKKRNEAAYYATVHMVDEHLVEYPLITIGNGPKNIPEIHVKRIIKEYSAVGWKIRRDTFIPACGGQDYLEFKV